MFKSSIVWKFTLYIVSSTVYETREYQCRIKHSEDNIGLRAKIGEVFFFFFSFFFLSPLPPVSDVLCRSKHFTMLILYSHICNVFETFLPRRLW